LERDENAEEAMIVQEGVVDIVFPVQVLTVTGEVTIETLVPQRGGVNTPTTMSQGAGSEYVSSRPEDRHRMDYDFSFSWSHWS